ncbi:hypothetical protein NLX83_13500 [Allokutzneria sp. A3M-2-11 16]|uniref:hypothetical protein n=1 Tax=Allokutzneria sp. A3M-2-11 16 TaxID=2962043 RepID=UPI0020B750EF|nr:hypothetical protein [Allokutzneria sp. A3M-2-11 16]MCP3800274.1 hypothetical protein [Allokutzneria sp. A3M-2-11 16]
MTGAGGDPKKDAERRKKLDELFGDVLPETTSDERDPGDRADRTADAWYYENRPPHHDT